MTGLAVVVPTHNRRELLQRAIASVPPGVDLIVVDDASTDGTPDLAAEIDARGRFLRLERNAGPGPARNFGAQHTTAELILFLDDDDMLLEGAVDAIVSAAQAQPDVALYLHNCRWSSGTVSLPPETPTQTVVYDEWLAGRWATELKPVARRQVFDDDGFDDTGASGEGLLWTRVVRDHGAVVVGGPPVIFYDVSHDERLTSTDGLLSRAARNADIADRWLALFGADQRRAAPDVWRGRVRAAALYHRLAGDGARARTLARTPGLTPADRALITALGVSPRRAVEAAFRLQRRAVGARAESGAAAE